MPRVLLLSFDSESLPSRQKSFEEVGFTVAAEEPSWPRALEAARRFAPDVIAVDCEKLPTHARETAEGLRKAPETRDAPVVLFRVADHDIERTRLKVPGGVVAYEYEIIDRLKSAALTRIANEAAAESAARAARPPRVEPAIPARARVPAPPAPRAPATRSPAPRAARRPAARKKGSAARKAPARKAPARKAPARKAPARKAAVRKAPARKAPARKKAAPRGRKK